MSRIGKLPVAVPQGVKAAVNGAVVSVEGPKGKLAYEVKSGVKVEFSNNEFVV